LFSSKGDTVSFVFFHSTFGADYACGLEAVSRNRPGVTSSNKFISFFAAFRGQLFDVVKPCEHGFVSLRSEDPGVSTVHGSGLAAFKHEFMR
jgi:hypothetical protein